MFRGVCTALITPFTEDGIDYDGFGRLIEYQIENGVSALLVCGTTGEPATMSSEEKWALIEFAIKKINKRVHVMVGTGANSTTTAIENSKKAEALGADSLLVVTPYYNKCTQAGLVEHYRMVCESVSLPVVAYNVPGRTGVNILPKTALALSEISNCVALKEACGNVSQIMETARLIQNKMTLYSGDDALCFPILCLGAEGLISVASNVAPRLVVDMVDAYLGGDFEKCRELQYANAELFDTLFCEVNPIPVKYACSLIGLCKNVLRMPLTPISAENATKVKNIMTSAGLL